jgi:esterase/lipase superfamily enzyme
MALWMALAAGCAGHGQLHELMPAPALSKPEAASELFGDVAPARRLHTVDLLYITDRAIEPKADTDRVHDYGQRRSASLAFGSARVAMQPAMGWEELRVESLKNPRVRRILLSVSDVTELGRYPEEPYRIRRSKDRVVRDPDTLARHRRANAALQAQVEHRLAAAPSGKIMLYVHGFNETFDSAANTAAELCHFFGRLHVCAFFTWPASSTGNPLLSYASTTESAQYSVGHLKRTIRALAQTPGVEGVQLLAHSRGAALLLNTVRELSIEAIASGRDPADALKLEQLVLMSPDIDEQVAAQKLEIFASDPDLMSNWRDDVLPRFLRGRFTVYASPEDEALKLSSFLFGSILRVGQLQPGAISATMEDYLSQSGNVDIIVYEGKRTDLFGHSYFLSNPEVSADLIELVRNGTPPGTSRRPLLRRGKVVWLFPPQKDGP